jgi:hypothetical protein
MFLFGYIKFKSHKNHYVSFCRWTLLVCFDAAHIIATKIAKKHYEGFDRGDSLGFQEFIQSWVGYELVKVLRVFGLQPQIRSDLANWSPKLFATFTYLSDRTNNKHREKATKKLDLLFDRTDHNS